MEHPPVTAGPVLLLEGNSESGAPWWRRWDLWLGLTVAMLSAFLLPLDDADLPMHLRTGAWILEHGEVPKVEPFAWTRAGAPFYAYSWLPEVLYALAWQWGGSMGLSALHALLLGAVVLALWDLSRAAQWSVWATRLILSVHLVLWLMVQPATRPQLFMAIALPMAWAAAFRLRGRSQMVTPLLLTVVANGIAVNAHLFFVLMLAPVVVLLGHERRDWRRVAAFGAASAGGWLVCPYVLQLPTILKLYLGQNALLGAASPIMELEGGFAVLLHAAIGTRILVGLLLVLPLLTPFAERTARERWWFGLAWLAGLGLYGLAVRGIVLWWLLALPMLAWAIAAVPLPRLATTQRAVVIAWCLSIVGLLGQAEKARALAPKVEGVPHPMAADLAGAVRWLDCLRAPEQAIVRGTTAFDYGSYLTWRMPQVSWSIDGRSIFPDSVAKADARQELRNGQPVGPPWRGSHVVLLTASHAVLRDIAADSAFVAVQTDRGKKAPAVALFVRRSLIESQPACSLR